jgi:hypothetical protein
LSSALNGKNSSTRTIRIANVRTMPKLIMRCYLAGAHRDAAPVILRGHNPASKELVSNVLEGKTDCERPTL